MFQDLDKVLTTEDAQMLVHGMTEFLLNEYSSSSEYSESYSRTSRYNSDNVEQYLGKSIAYWEREIVKAQREITVNEEKLHECEFTCNGVCRKHSVNHYELAVREARKTIDKNNASIARAEERIIKRKHQIGLLGKLKNFAYPCLPEYKL